MKISRQLPAVVNKAAAMNLFAYGFTHMLVDGTCAAVIFGGMGLTTLDSEQFALLVVLYNTLAFGFQVTIGELADTLGNPKGIALIGCFLAGLSAVFIKIPLLAIIFAGFGNAAFHIGGGVISLSLKPGKAAAPGIFVAPGALGLLFGTLYGRRGHFSLPVIEGLLIIGAMAVIISKPPEGKRCFGAENRGANGVRLAVSLILLSICLRSFVGFTLNYPWKSDAALLFIFTAAAASGKALGGILSDRLGWVRVTICGLIASSAMLPLGDKLVIPAAIGVFLFNLTMPVTLTAVSNLLPGRPGFSFGLTTMALLLGAIPSFTSLKGLLYDNRLILVSVLVMTLILYSGLRLYNNKEKMALSKIKLGVFKNN